MDVEHYLRWSDQHQSRGSSLTRQSRACADFTLELGWDHTGDLIEDGKSAFSGANLDPQKGELGRFESKVRAGDKSGRAIMVEKIDRLTRRNGFDALRWLGDMVECGLTIAIADKKMVVNSRTIRFQSHQLKQLLDEIDKANAYSDLLGTRVRAAWQTMRDGKTILAEYDGVVLSTTVVGDRQDVTRIEVSRGKRTDLYWINTTQRPVSVGDEVADGQVLGVLNQKVHAESTCPAWLEIIENRTTFRVRPNIAAIIECIFVLYTTTDLGARGIAKLFNGEPPIGCADPATHFRGQDGAVPVLRDGRCWHGSTIKVLLKNRAVLGEYEYAVKRQKTGTVVADYFPQIISDELFQAANDKKLTKIKGNHSRTSRTRHLFSDVGRCFKCDSKLTYVTKRTREDGRYETYGVCSSAYLNTGCDQKHSLRMIPVEDAVLDNLLELMMDDDHFIDEANLPELRRDLAEKKRVLEGIQRRIEALLDLIGDKSFRRDERFDMRLRTAQNEEETARDALRSATERLVAAQGRVTPEEHVTRVSEIRGDLWSADEAKGQRARLKVKMALNELLDVLYVSAEHRQAVLVLKGGVRKLVLDWHGKLTSDLKIWRAKPTDKDVPAVRSYFERMAKAKVA
jgi:DNA invertase Pin-like site-specific DNA recombinase